MTEIRVYEAGNDIFAVTSRGTFLINPESGAEYEPSYLPDDAAEVLPGIGYDIEIPEEII